MANQCLAELEQAFGAGFDRERAPAPLGHTRSFYGGPHVSNAMHRHFTQNFARGGIGDLKGLAGSGRLSRRLDHRSTPLLSEPVTEPPTAKLSPSGKVPRQEPSNESSRASSSTSAAPAALNCNRCSA